MGLTPVSVIQSLKKKETGKKEEKKEIGNGPAKMVSREIEVLRLLRHPYIIQLLGIES